MVDGLTNPDANADYSEYHVCYLEVLRLGLEAIAFTRGLTLARPELPAAHPTISSTYLRYLKAEVRKMPDATPLQSYERKKALIQIFYLQNRDRYAVGVDADYVREASEILGRPKLDRGATERALELFAVSSGSAQEDQLPRFFYKHVMRECLMAASPEVPERNHHYMFDPLAPMMEMFRKAVL